MPTLLETKQQQLAEVNQAITAVLTRSQSHMVQDGGAMRQVTRANIKHLEEMRTKLEFEVARLENGGIAVNYGLPK